MNQNLDEKYIIFNKWCASEGVIMPKLQYPATFEGGLIGTKVTEDILHREVYLYVPYKIILTVHNTQQHKVLKPIIDAHPEVFSEDEYESWEFLTLTLRLLYEKTLGKDSYWFPYINALPDVQFTA